MMHPFVRGLAALSGVFALFLAPAPAAAQDGRSAAVAPATPAAAEASSAAAARAWGFADSDVIVDPAVRFGVLPNGMKYALRRNTTPQSAIAMRLHFDVGSLFEREDERGIAHYLEHMAFNGSANVPEGEMVRLLERNGLAFGADTNASTGFDATTYRLDLPTNDDGLIDTALMLFGEIAQALTIAPDAVDRERGVVLSEMRARDNYALRNQVDQLAFALPGTIIPERMPIGTGASLTAMTAAQLRSFYDRYYRPERATLVIVGDFDLDAIEARLTSRFADWVGRGAAGAEPDLGRPDFARPSAADLYTHPALPESVTIAWFRPWVERDDSLALRRQLLLESIGERILRRRFARLALGNDAPISGAGFSESGAFELVRSASLSAQTRDGQWRAAMQLVEQEYRRALQHGFAADEVAEQVAGMTTAYRAAAAGSATRQSGSLAGQLLGVADGRSVATAPEFEESLFLSVVDGATADSVTAAFRAMMADYGQPIVRVTSKAPIDGGEPALLAALAASAQTAVAAADDERAIAAFAYTDFGRPGLVVSDDRIADLDIRRVRFANGVMLNIKRTDFEDDRVRVLVHVDGGGQLATRDDPTRVTLSSLMPLGGLEAHSADELRTILAGRSVSSGFGAASDAFVMGATTTPGDLTLQAQLFAATITHPGYRPEAVNLLRRVLPAQYAALDAAPGAVLSRDVAAILANDDPLARTPPLDVMMALDWDGFRAAAADSLANGAIEVGIVGAVDEAAAIATIAATFGALPTRRADFVRDPTAFERRFAQDRTLRTLHHRGEAEQAIVQSYWPARDDSDLADAIRLQLLAAVMEILLTDELREHLGQSYSPGAAASLSSDFPEYGYLSVSATVAVGDIASVESAIDAVVSSVRSTRISDDLFERARRPIVENVERARRDNGYWLGYVARATSHADRLDRSRQALTVLAAMTPDDVLAMAQRYLQTQDRLGIRVVPAANP